MLPFILIFLLKTPFSNHRGRIFAPEEECSMDAEAVQCRVLLIYLIFIRLLGEVLHILSHIDSLWRNVTRAPGGDQGASI